MTWWISSTFLHYSMLILTLIFFGFVFCLISIVSDVLDQYIIKSFPFLLFSGLWGLNAHNFPLEVKIAQHTFNNLRIGGRAPSNVSGNPSCAIRETNCFLFLRHKGRSKVKSINGLEISSIICKLLT